MASAWAAAIVSAWIVIRGNYRWRRLRSHGKKGPLIESCAGPKLDAVTAEKVFDWKNVHNHPMTRAASLWLKEANRPI
jgi:hypothetical protein